MKDHIYDLRQINYLTNEIDYLYHRASLKLGITDSVSIVLYIIYDEGGRCPVSDIYKKTGISKQTVNSALRSLEKEGILCLEQNTGRRKTAVLTDKGRAYTENTAARLYQAEINALGNWQDEEVMTYIRLLKKFKDCLQIEIEKL